MDEETLEHKWASKIMPLPIDQRYGEDEMRYMARELIRELDKTNERNRL